MLQRRTVLNMIGGVLAGGVIPRRVKASRDPRSVAVAPLPTLRFVMTEVAPQVYCATAEGVPYYVANSVLILGPDGSLLVDSSAGPREARALRTAIAAITTRPVRYVVETHFHFDHALGESAFPEAVTIMHPATREGLRLGTAQPTFAANLRGIPAKVADLRAKAAAETDAATRTNLEGEAVAWDGYAAQMVDLTPVASTLTFRDGLTLWLGNREIHILHLGRGHTAGDTVVYLPAERVVCSGDLFNGYIGYMGDAYVDEWADTLGRLAALDFRQVIAGHGKPFEGKEAIAPVQACLRDLWAQADALKRSGVSATDAAARIDLRAHAGRFPQLATVGYTPLALERIYAVIDTRTTRR